MEFKLNAKIYPIEAILNACYVFVDRTYIFLDTDTKGNYIEVTMKDKDNSSAKDLEALRGEFMNELLYSCLRFKISKNNKKIREYIVGRALYSTIPESDLFAQNQEMDYQEDPLGIAIPWEEKYGKNKKRSKIKV